MTVIELKKRLIQKINQTENNGILEEMYRLIVNEDTDSNIYILSDDQKNAVEEAQQQFKNGRFLNSDHIISETMLTKDQLNNTIKTLPDSFTIDELIEQVIFMEKVEEGYQQSDAGKVISNEDVKLMIDKWSK